MHHRFILFLCIITSSLLNFADEVTSKGQVQQLAIPAYTGRYCIVQQFIKSYNRTYQQIVELYRQGTLSEEDVQELLTKIESIENFISSEDQENIPAIDILQRHGFSQDEICQKKEIIMHLIKMMQEGYIKLKCQVVESLEKEDIDKSLDLLISYCKQEKSIDDKRAFFKQLAQVPHRFHNIKVLRRAKLLLVDDSSENRQHNTFMVYELSNLYLAGSAVKS